MLLIGDNRREIDIFHTLKDILLDKGVGFLHLGNQMFNLHAL